MEALSRQLSHAFWACIAPAILLGALALALAPASGLAAHVDCGDRVTHYVRLDADLVNCRGNGLNVAADGVTIDLGGHVVDGRGRGTGIFNGQWGEGRRDVTIRNGTVRGFKIGIRSSAPRSRVTGLTVTRNAAGGISLRSRECRVDRNVVAANAYGHGIFVGGVSGCRIEKNRVTGHLGAGIEASRSRAHVIEHNRVARNRQAGILLAGTAGVRVAHNTVQGNDGPGVWLFDNAAANLVTGNTMAANDSGILVSLGGVANRIVSNSVSGSRKTGIRLLETGEGNFVTENLVVLNGHAGIVVTASPQALVERNAVYDNGNVDVDAAP